MKWERHKILLQKFTKSASLGYSQYVHHTNLRNSVQDLNTIRPTLKRDDYTREKPLHRKGNGHVFWCSWKFCVFLSVIDYTYHQITCDITRKAAREVREIGSWRYFSYYASWRVNSRISLQNVRTRSYMPDSFKKVDACGHGKKI